MKRVVAVVAVLVSCTVLAQMGNPGPIDDRGRDHKFGGDAFKGLRDTPMVPVLYVKPKTSFDSLIKVRANFQPELQKSVEGVK